ncbi:MAG: DUF1697 domain-containing protein [Burkholderiales bacterium]|nr:DUF1697 domain-containing protein [Burkholderiales bacterium]MDE2075697.1 DUF1697 domain-containing protein [Burkholderiales bacterium]MDE2431617.1 DUF1697 domain-containing protein [Burkholderiales bacterium]
MQTFIALLRGINVGKANRLPMADLRALLLDQGYDKVVTLLNSGNAVFRASKGSPAEHASAIASAISSELGLDVPVIVKSAQELSTVIQDNPLDTHAADHSQLLVAFVQNASTLQGLRAIEQLAAPTEPIAFGEHAAYLHCANGILESKAAKALVGKMGQAATTRNWATVLKLQALANKGS